MTSHREGTGMKLTLPLKSCHRTTWVELDIMLSKVSQARKTRVACSPSLEENAKTCLLEIKRTKVAGHKLHRSQTLKALMVDSNTVLWYF